MITREVLHLIVVTHKICCQEAQKDKEKFCVILKEELSEGLGPAAEQTHG